MQTDEQIDRHAYRRTDRQTARQAYKVQIFVGNFSNKVVDLLQKFNVNNILRLVQLCPHLPRQEHPWPRPSLARHLRGPWWARSWGFQPRAVSTLGKL
jgi:hypothetical protein